MRRGDREETGGGGRRRRRSRARRAAALTPVLLWAVVSCTPPGPEGGEEAKHSSLPPVHVVFDQSLDQISSPFDTAFEGMSRLTVMLRRHGATVSVNNRPLEEFLPTIHGPGRVLVLGIPWRRHYTQAALHAIVSFLGSGGGVLVITEHDNFYGHTDVQNALIAPLGITTLPSQAREQPREEDAPVRGWPICRIGPWGFSKVRLYLPAPLRLRSPAEVLAEIIEPEHPANAVVAAVNRRLPGVLVVMADLEVLWNMSPDTGIRAGENAPFLLRLFGELAGREGNLELESPRARIDGWREGERLALFESTGMGWFPDGAPNGLDALAERLHRNGYRIEVGGGRRYPYREVDLLIVAVPLARLEAPRRMLGARRILLVGDGRSNLIEAEPKFTELFRETFELDTREYFYPLNAAAAPHHFQFLAATLISEKTAGTIAKARWAGSGETIPLYRSSVIALTGPEDDPISVVAYADRGYWLGANLVPVLYDGWVENPGRRPVIIREGRKEIRAKLPVIVESQQVMGVADLELLTDQGLETPEGERVVGELLRWLATEPASEAEPGRQPGAASVPGWDTMGAS